MSSWHEIYQNTKKKEKTFVWKETNNHKIRNLEKQIEKQMEKEIEEIKKSKDDSIRMFKAIRD